MPQQLCKLKRAVSRDFQPTYFCYCIKKARSSGPHMKRLKRLRFVFCFLRRHLSTCQHTVVVDYMDSQFSSNLKLKNQLRLFIFFYFSIVKLFTGCPRSLHCVDVLNDYADIRFCRYLRENEKFCTTVFVSSNWLQGKFFVCKKCRQSL